MAELSEEQWTLVGMLFEQAAELPPEQLAAFLDKCPDAGVREEVASLLEYSGSGLSSAGAAIRSLAGAAALARDPDQRLIGVHLGPYKVEAIVGHGGMGAVYRAVRDDAEYDQQVAIKLVRAAAASPSMLLRFKRERRILARLAHTNIARLLDGGSTPEGVPYLVMEFIEGQPITAWCESHALKIPERLRLFLPVCQAVEFAHKRLVVHRDLKPGNILVNDDGIPKLLDFGIAKLLDANAPGESESVTQTGWQIMTPEYAAPEQVRGDPVSPAADVYGLGLILYEMLAGRKAQKMTGYSPGTIAKIVCQTEPPTPASLNPQLAGDVDSIIRMAIRKEPERRYSSAGELARDIERHLQGHPVRARSDTFYYRVGKFVRRNRGAVAAAAVVCVSLAIGLLLSLNARLARMPRVTQVTQLTLVGSVEVTGPVATDGTRVYFTERKGGSWWLAQVPVGGGLPQRLALPEGEEFDRPKILDISSSRSSLLVAAGGEEDDQALWVVPTTGGAPRRLGNLFGHAGCWSRDGRKIDFAFGTALYQVSADGTDRRKLIDLPGYADLVHHAPAPGRDVLRFHVVDGKRQPALWEVGADGTGLHRLLVDWQPGADSHIERAGDWTSSGKYYFYQSRHGRVRGIWAIKENHSWLPSFNRSPVELYSTAFDMESLAVSPDGRRIFIGAGQERREFTRYDHKLREFRPFLPGLAGRWVDFSPDGRWVAYSGHPEGALWRCRPDGSDAMQLTPPSMSVQQPRWSPDGTRIAFRTPYQNQPEMLYLIPASGGTPEAIPAASYVDGEASWSPDGQSLLFGRVSYGGAPVNTGVYMMDLGTRAVSFLPGSEQLMQPKWSPDGRYVVAHRDRKQLLLFDFRTGRWIPLAKGAGLRGLYWSHDAKSVYYQEEFAGLEQAISRVEISTRKVERMMDLKRIPQSNVTAYYFNGLAPGDSPIVSVTRTNSDIYALDLELP